MEGLLWKKGEGTSSYWSQPRYFREKSEDFKLYYYDSQTTVHATNSIDYRNIRKVEPVNESSWLGGIAKINGYHWFRIVTKTRTFELGSESVQTRDRWVEHLLSRMAELAAHPPQFDSVLEELEPSDVQRRPFKCHVSALAGIAAGTGTTYSTWEVQLESIEEAFGNQKQGWNRDYENAKKIFDPARLIGPVQSAIMSQHALLYADSPLNTTGGDLKSGQDLLKILNNGTRAGRPCVYTYVLLDSTWYFSETGANFFRDLFSKHAVHANCSEEVWYAGEFRIVTVDKEHCLVLDNNSGTYAPSPELLPNLQAVFQVNFPDLKIEAVPHDDPRIKEWQAAEAPELAPGGAKQTHLFVQQTFIKPTWCEHCGQILSGLFNQGLTCSRCQMTVHSKCLEATGTFCYPAEAVRHELKILDLEHQWFEKRVTGGNLAYCNVCHYSLKSGQGLACKICRIMVHHNCRGLARPNCRSPIQSGALRHHWVLGNLSQTIAKPRCSACSKEAGSNYCLIDYHCCWCRSVVHTSCFRTQENHSDCQLGSFRNLLVSPADLRINEQTNQPEIVQSSPDLRPLAVLLQPQQDPASVNRLQDVQRKLLQRLNQLQLHDFTHARDAEPFLSAFADQAFILVIAGNDKIVGTLLLLCQKVFSKRNPESWQFPPLLFYPIGSPTSLADYLNWNVRTSHKKDVDDWLDRVQHAEAVPVDIWRLSFPPSTEVELFCSHFSLGLDVWLKDGKSQKEATQLATELNKCLELYLGRNESGVQVDFQTLHFLNLPDPQWETASATATAYSASDPADGKLEVVIVNGFQKTKFAQTGRIKMVTSVPCAVSLDGRVQSFPPFTLQIDHSGRQVNFLRNAS